MRRRDFVRRVGGGVVGAGLISGGACFQTDSPAGHRMVPGFRAWTWVHGGGEVGSGEWRGRFGRLREGGITAVLVSGGDTQLLSDAARAEGLEFHRWIWTLNRNGDERVRLEHPEWFTVSRNGDSTLEKPPYVGYYRWVCPTRAPVREYLRGIVDELALDERVDGVHLDYVRHSDVILPVGLWSRYDLVQDREHPEFDFCYCEVCRSTFEAQTGHDPLDLPDPPNDDAWVRFRWDGVTRLVSELAEAVHARSKPITAAVFPTPTIARRLVRQAWDEWPVDAVFPMLYHSFYEEALPWIGACVREGRAAGVGTSEGRSPGALYAGLYLPDLPPAEMRRALEIAREAGAGGVSFFDSGGLSDEHLLELAAALR